MRKRPESGAETRMSVGRKLEKILTRKYARSLAHVGRKAYRNTRRVHASTRARAEPLRTTHHLLPPWTSDMCWRKSEVGEIGRRAVGCLMNNGGNGRLKAGPIIAQDKMAASTHYRPVKMTASVYYRPKTNSYRSLLPTKGGHFVTNRLSSRFNIVTTLMCQP